MSMMLSRNARYIYFSDKVGSLRAIGAIVGMSLVVG